MAFYFCYLSFKVSLTYVSICSIDIEVQYTIHCVFLGKYRGPQDLPEQLEGVCQLWNVCDVFLEGEGGGGRWGNCQLSCDLVTSSCWDMQSKQTTHQPLLKYRCCTLWNCWKHTHLFIIYTVCKEYESFILIKTPLTNILSVFPPSVTSRLDKAASTSSISGSLEKSRGSVDMVILHMWYWNNINIIINNHHIMMGIGGYIILTATGDCTINSR